MKTNNRTVRKVGDWTSPMRHHFYYERHTPNLLKQITTLVIKSSGVETMEVTSAVWNYGVLGDIPTDEFILYRVITEEDFEKEEMENAGRMTTEIVSYNEIDYEKLIEMKRKNKETEHDHTEEGLCVNCYEEEIKKEQNGKSKIIY